MIQTQWWMGVVEDRHDPLKLGRVRVRIAGAHSETKTESDDTGRGIPTEKLPWAYVMQSIDSAAMNGIGQSPTGIVEGTWVVGFARDEMYNDLVVMGTLGGIPSGAPNGQVGFNDPNEVYPKPDFLDEADTNRLARGEKTAETIVQTKKDGIDKDVPIANEAGEGKWTEPETPYAAEYPYNHVKETESGHIEEFDDTEGAERIHKYHRTGTFEEIHPDGTVVRKIVLDNYTIIAGNDFCHISGNTNLTVNGDCNLYIIGNVEEQVDGNVNRVVKQNITELVEGNIERTVKGNITETVEGNVDEKVNGNRSENVGGNVNETVGGSETTNVSGAMTKKASVIKLN